MPVKPSWTKGVDQVTLRRPDERGTGKGTEGGHVRAAHDVRKNRAASSAGGMEAVKR